MFLIEIGRYSICTWGCMGITREQNLLHFIFGGRGFKEEVVSLCETWFDFLEEEGLGCGVKMGGIEQMVCDTFFNGICAGMMAFYNACRGLEFKDCRFLFEFVMEVMVVDSNFLIHVDVMCS